MVSYLMKTYATIDVIYATDAAFTREIQSFTMSLAQCAETLVTKSDTRKEVYDEYVLK